MRYSDCFSTKLYAIDLAPMYLTSTMHHWLMRQRDHRTLTHANTAGHKSSPRLGSPMPLYRDVYAAKLRPPDETSFSLKTSTKRCEKNGSCANNGRLLSFVPDTDKGWVSQFLQTRAPLRVVCWETSHYLLLPVCGENMLRPTGVAGEIKKGKPQQTGQFCEGMCAKKRNVPFSIFYPGYVDRVKHRVLSFLGKRA